MGKHISNLVDGIMSFAKAAPLIVGGLGGLIVSPGRGYQNPVQDIRTGNLQSLQTDLAATYLFYDGQRFAGDMGNGAKLLAAGVIIHKLLGWID